MTSSTPRRATPATAGPAGRPSRLQSLQLSAVIWLTVVWVALWGDLSFANVLGGLALGVAVSLAFPLPPLHMRLRLHPWHLLVLTGRFLADIVVASVLVIRVVLSKGEVRSSVIAVTLTTPSDLVLTLVAELTSLVPGSVVVEVRRSSHTLFLHVLNTPDLDAAERMRTHTLELEQRVIAAIGAPTIGEPSGIPGKRP